MYYKYLLFDLDNTLLDFDLAEDVALTALLLEYEVSDIDAYKAYYKPMNKQMWRDLEAGLLTKKDLVKSRFAKLFAHFGEVKDGVYLAERYQHHLAQQGQVYDGAKELLERLNQLGYVSYAATNGITAIQEGRLSQSGLRPYFENVFISEQAGTQKPAKAFYSYVASQIEGFSPEKTLMIGDSLTADVQGGNNAGIDTVWYNPKHLVNATSARPTYTVADYTELLNLLRAPDSDRA